MIDSKKLFLGGMNTDDSPLLIDNDAYLNLINGRIAISEDGRNLRIENTKGTDLLTNGLLPSGDNFCIGSTLDTVRNRIIYFNWNSGGEHGIYARDVLTNQNYIVLLNSNLIPTRVTCEAVFFGGGSNYGTTANFTYSGVSILGDVYAISFQRFSGGSNFGVSVTTTFEETLESALARLVVLFNADSIAIANGLTAVLVGTTIQFNFNSVLWLGSNNITLAELTNKPLNFSKDYRIDRNARVIGDLLYWTDNYNPPRKINVEAGIVTNQPNYVTTQTPYFIPIDYKSIQWVKRPPIYPIEWEKQTDGSTSSSINLIENNAFFFTYQYQFRDNEKSALATYSKLVPFNTKLNPYGLQAASTIVNDTFNLINLEIPVEEKIESDIVLINIYVKYGENGKLSLIKTFDRRDAFDEATIESHNASSTTSFLTYFFRNNVEGVTLPNADIVESDNLPLLNKSVEVAKNRLFSANNLYGYTTLLKTSLTVNRNVATTTNYTKVYNSFKENASYLPSISFYDEFKRKCGSLPIDVFYNTVNTIFTPSAQFVDYITWTLSNADALNEIPDWAYYYSIDLSKNLDYTYLLTGAAIANQLRYAIKNNDGTITYSNTYNSGYYGIAINLQDVIANDYAYVFNEGDYCQLDFLNTYGSFGKKILAVDGVNLIVELSNIGTLPLNTGNLLKYTILTLRKESANDLFFQKGEIYKINNPTKSNRQYSILTDNIYGDVYISIHVTSFVSPRYYNKEMMSPNYLRFNDWETNNGFVNIVDNIGQKLLPTTIAFSDTIILQSRTNNLNKFQPTNRVDSTTSPIQKLQLTNKKQEDGTVMLVITQDNVVSAYLGETQLVAASQNDALATSQGVIGTINALRNNFGTLNPESVFEYMGNVYWVDVVNGVVAQYSPNGIFPISDYKVNRFFKKYAKDYKGTSKSVINSINGFSHITTCVDPFHREVMVTTPALIYENYATNLPSYTSVPSYATSIINRFDLADKLGKTLAFDYEENKWRSNYEFMPEWMEHANNELFGFKDGNLYSFNTNSSNYNTWFGVQYPIRLCANWNIKEMPSIIKDVFDIALESNVKPDFTVLMSTYPNVQITDLTADDYNDTEGVFYARFYLDRLSPNATGTPEEKLYKGDVIKAQAPQIMLEFQQYNSLVYINFVQVGFAVSRGQLKIIQK